MAEAVYKNVLIKTKYGKPEMNQYLVSRRRLHRKLNSSLACKLTLVMAPAGYGKTTAVLDWLRKCSLPVVWMSLDSYDNNPVVFWRYLCTSLDGISNGLGKDTEYVFSSLELLKANIHINILIDRLSGVQKDFLLVLDDLHLITDSSTLKGLSYLIDYLPAKMHLLFISRTEPELNLARHRIKWQINRLEEKDLRFEEEEIFQFYHARGHLLKDDDVKKVETYTEGWAAAMVAVAMSMEDDRSSRNAIDVLTRSNRDIEKYLDEEVISIWLPEKRSFAMKTCILDTLSEALCDAVTGDNNGHRMLKEISEGSGFLTAVDNQGQEYRYHPLFKSFLHKFLLDTIPEQIPGLHKRAACWFRERSFLPEAVEHLLSAGSFGETLEIIEHQIDHLINMNDFGTLLSWIERLPAELKDNSFKIAVIYALYYAETGCYNLSRQWIGRMKALKEDYKYASSLQWNNYSQTVCILAEANLFVREGSLEFVPLLLSAAKTDGGRYFKMPGYNDFNKADIYFYRCPVNRLAALFREEPDKYCRMMEDYRGMISKNPGYAPLGIGECFYENNRLEEALPHLLKALEEARETNCLGAFVPAIVDIARIKKARGDIPGAFEALEECEKKLQSCGKIHWIYLLQAFRCRLHIDMGDKAKVEEWFASCKLNTFTEINRVREFELIVYARVLMARGRQQDAELLLQRLLTFTERSIRRHSQVEVLNLLALLAHENGDMKGAIDYLGKSLKIGMDEGYVRSYADEPAPMVDLLRYYIARRRRTGHPAAVELAAYAKKLLIQMQKSLSAATTVSIEASAAGMKKLLTAQERKVLELLANANTNKEIGEKLDISLTTVKTHTGNIYGKLGVKNRSQCMKLIRETGLLE